MGWLQDDEDCSCKSTRTVLGKGMGGANKFFCTLVLISLPGGQDRWFRMQVGGKGWKVVAHFGVFFPTDLFFLFFAGENLQGELHRKTEGRTFLLFEAASAVSAGDALDGSLHLLLRTDVLCRPRDPFAFFARASLASPCVL